MEDTNESLQAVPVRVLTSDERRVLGVLIEKAFCTPDAYPLTANALITGCSQKSNRDPVLELPAHRVDEALLSLQKSGLVTRVFPATGRTERWRHNLKDVWQLERAQRAVLGELLLRGTQTEGDLRARASRMVDVGSLEEMRAVLEGLESRQIVKRLSPEGQKRGVFWTHQLYSPQELDRVVQKYAHLVEDESDEPTPTIPGAPRSPISQAANASSATSAPLVREGQNYDLEQLRQQVIDLQTQVAALHTAHHELANQFATFQKEWQG